MNGKKKHQRAPKHRVNSQLYALCRAGTDPAIDRALETPREKLSRLLAVDEVLDKLRAAFSGPRADEDET